MAAMLDTLNTNAWPMPDNANATTTVATPGPVPSTANAATETATTIMPPPISHRTSTRCVMVPTIGDSAMSGTVMARNTAPALTALRPCTC